MQLGKNGTLYENSLGGKSVQFFSTAGDGSLRLWDIRPSKVGLDEFDAIPEQDIIRSNMWAHLENNNWKYSAKVNGSLELMNPTGSINHSHFLFLKQMHVYFLT